MCFISSCLEYRLLKKINKTLTCIFKNSLTEYLKFNFSAGLLGLLFGSCHFYFLPALCSSCCPLHTVHALGRADLSDGFRGELPGVLCFLRPSGLNNIGTHT